MFFILSKILFFLLKPFWWIVFLLMWRWRSKKPVRRKRLLIASIVILILFTNPFLYKTIALAWQTAPVSLPVNKTYDAGIVLGGLSGYDKNFVGYFGPSSDRFIQTANLYHQGIIRKVIISGGTGSINQDEPAESFFLREQFIHNGVHDSDIIIESASRNTYENAVFSKRITDSLQLHPPFILVTSAQHMRRSIAVFKKAGFNFIPFPCDYHITPFNTDISTFIPAISLLDEWSGLLKEMVGLWVYRFTGKA